MLITFENTFIEVVNVGTIFFVETQNKILLEILNKSLIKLSILL